MVFAAILVITAMVFLAPGLCIAISAGVFRHTPRPVVLAQSIAINAALGYAAFWMFFFNRGAGFAFSAMVSAAALGCVLSLLRNVKLRHELLHADFAIPLSLMVLTGAFYLAIVLLGAKDHPHASHRFLSHELPPDNIIPLIFSENLAEGRDPRNALGDVSSLSSSDVNSWHSSDRPPLQAGLALLHRAWLFPAGWDPHAQYLWLGLLAQCLWIPALWAFCRTAGISMRTTALALAGCIFSGFFLLNSVYVWPKLLAAALALLGLTAIVAATPRQGGPVSVGSLVLSATLGALALLAHSGVGFFYPAIAVVALTRRYFSGLRSAGLFLAVFAAWMLPWSAYQKFYDPPGNRLLKWHLAGAIDADPRSFPQALWDSYSHLSLDGFIASKSANAETLVGPDRSARSFLWPPRVEQFFYLVKTLGALNFGWIALAVLFLRRRFAPRSRDALDARSNEAAWSARLLGMALATAAFWILLMFLPESTVVHQGSYAMVMAFFIGLCIAIAQFPIWVWAPVLAIQFGHFTWVWALSVTDGAQMRVNFAAIACLLAAIIGVELVWIARRPEEPAGI